MGPLKCWEALAIVIVLLLISGAFTVAYGHGGGGGKGGGAAAERNQDSVRYELVQERTIGVTVRTADGTGQPVTRLIVVATYDSQSDCEREAKNLNARAPRARPYLCRPALSS